MSNETTFVSQRQQVNDKFKASIDGNRPTALEAIKRADYANDDQYISALAQYEFEATNEDPRLAQLRRKYSRIVYEENEQKRREAQAAEFEKNRENTRLDFDEQKAAEKAAADKVYQLYQAGHVDASDLARATKEAQKKAVDNAIGSKAGATFLNQMFRQEYAAQKGISPSAEKQMSKDLKTDLMGRKNAW